MTLKVTPVRMMSGCPEHNAPALNPGRHHARTIVDGKEKAKTHDLFQDRASNAGPSGGVWLCTPSIGSGNPRTPD